MPISTDFCIVPSGGYPTQDGYLRALTKLRREGGKLKMIHRMEWEKVHGPIPEGYEVNHMCKRRNCANVNHLELLTRSEHKAEGNAHRAKRVGDKIFNYWLKNPLTTQGSLGRRFSRTQGSISNTLKRYRERYGV